MALVIKKLTQENDKPITRKLLLYGDTGSGKTHLAGSAQDVAEMADVLVGSIDGGVATLTSRGDIMATDTRNAQAVEELLWLLVKRDASVKNVRTLVLDGGSEMQKADLASIAQAAALKKDTRNKDLNERQDYKLNKGKMERIMRMARDIQDVNLIVTCWAKKTYPVGPDGQPAANVAPISIVPDLTKGVAATVLGFFDDAWFIEKQKNSENRVLYTGEYKGIFAKTRDQAVARVMSTEGKDGTRLPYIVNPTFTDIYARYKRAYAKP